MTDQEQNKKKRRNYIFYSILLAAALITALSTISEAATNRPLRYYSGDGGTAMTYYLNSTGDQNRSLWGINTDNPLCELDINGSICINRTGYYLNGVPLGGGAPGNAAYITTSLDPTLTDERVLNGGKGITVLDFGPGNLVTVNITGLEDCTASQGSQWNGTEWNCISGGGDNNYTTSQAFERSGNNIILQTARNGMNNVSAFFTLQSSTGILTTNGITYANATNCSSGQYSRYEQNGWNCYNDASGGSGTVTSITINSTTPAVSVVNPTVTTSGIVVVDIANATASNDGLMTSVQATSLSLKALAGNCVGYNSTHVNVTMNTTTAGPQCVAVSLNPGSSGTPFVYSDYFNQFLNKSSSVEFGNLVPNANNTYDLGNSTRYWRDLYISNGTIHLGPSMDLTASSLDLLGNGVAFMYVNDQRYNYTGVIGLLYTNVTALQTFRDAVYVNVTALQTFRDGIYTNVTGLQTFRDAVYVNVTILQTNSGQYYQNITDLQNSNTSTNTRINTVNTTTQNLLTSNTSIYGLILVLGQNDTNLNNSINAVNTRATTINGSVVSLSTNLTTLSNTAITTFGIKVDGTNSTMSNSSTFSLYCGSGVTCNTTTTSPYPGVTIVGTGGGNSFTTMSTPSGTSPVADSSTDTLNFAAGAGITITGDSSTDTITFTASSGGGNVSGGSINGTLGFVAHWNSTTTITNSSLYVDASTGDVVAVRVINATRFSAQYGDVARPAYTYGPKNNTGIYSDSTGQFMVADDGVKIFQANADGIQVPSGTVTFPAIKSTSDDDTGLFYPSANVMGLTANGNQGGGLVMTFSVNGTNTLNSSSWQVQNTTSVFNASDNNSVKISAVNVGLDRMLTSRATTNANTFQQLDLTLTPTYALFPGAGSSTTVPYQTGVAGGVAASAVGTVANVNLAWGGAMWGCSTGTGYKTSCASRKGTLDNYRLAGFYMTGNYFAVTAPGTDSTGTNGFMGMTSAGTNASSITWAENYTTAASAVGFLYNTNTTNGLGNAWHFYTSDGSTHKAINTTVNVTLGNNYVYGVYCPPSSAAITCYGWVRNTNVTAIGGSGEWVGNQSLNLPAAATALAPGISYTNKQATTRTVYMSGYQVNTFPWRY